MRQLRYILLNNKYNFIELLDVQKDTFSVRSDGKFFRVTFRSNDRLDGTGFRASYKFKASVLTTEASIMSIKMRNVATVYKGI